MNEIRSMKKWIISLLAFLFGQAFLWGINPFVSAFFISVCMLGEGSVILFALAIAGMLLKSFSLYGNTPSSDKWSYNGSISYLFGEISAPSLYIVGKYIILIVLIVMLIKLGKIKKRNVSLLLICVTVTVSLFSFLPYMATKYALIYTGAEAVITFCLLPILKSAFKVILDGEYDRDKYNEQMLSIMCVSAIALWGLPVLIANKIIIVEAVGLLLSLYVIHRFGAGFGVGLTCICGTIMAIKCAQPKYIGSCFIIAVFAIAARTLSGKKKLGTLAGFIIGALVAGITYSDYFLSISGLKLIITVALLFLAIPKNLLIVKDSYTFGIHTEAAALEMNRITAEKIRDMANAFKRIEYTIAGCGPTAGKVSLSQIGEMIGKFSDNLENVHDTGDSSLQLKERLSKKGLELLHITMLKNEQNHEQYFVTGRTNSRHIVLAKDVAEILSDEFNQNIRTSLNTSSIFSENDRTVVFEEEAYYKCYYHVRRIKKYGSQISGDNFSVKEAENGTLAMMVSDGMGSGSLASCESSLLIDTMEELLEAGFDPLYAISFANECLSEKNNGKTFTTFDLGIVDLYEGSLTTYKQGAAATYVVHAGVNENDVEIIRGTTLPIGVLSHIECDVSHARLCHGDAVIMVSDGIYSGDGDDDYEGYLIDTLRSIDTGNSRDIVEEIISEMLCANQGSFNDDVTVIAAVIEKNS